MGIIAFSQNSTFAQISAKMNGTSLIVIICLAIYVENLGGNRVHEI